MFFSTKPKPMKNPGFKYLAFLFLMSSFLFSSCSKDKRIERALFKKEGQWNITSVTWEKVIVNSSGSNVSMGTTTNAGIFSFEKDGSGSYEFTIDGSTYSQTFGWSVNEEAIAITRVSQSFDFSGNFDQLAVAFSGTQSNKTNIVLDGSETHQYSSGSVTETVIAGTFSLTKK